MVACLLSTASSAGEPEKQIAYIKGHVVEDAKIATDPRRRLEIIRNDANWWKWQADQCAHHSRNAKACVAETLALRRAIIDAQSDGPPLSASRYADAGYYSFPKNPPEDWWGVVLWSAEKRPADTSFRSEVMVDNHGNPKILTMTGSGRNWDSNDAALIDAFSRHVEQTYASAPDLWGNLESRKQAWLRLGLTPLRNVSGAPPLPSKALRISPSLDVFNEPYGCMDLLSFGTVYWFHDVREKMNEGKLWPEIADLPGAHVFERFEKRETNRFNGRCDQDTSSTITADFLPMEIEFWGRFPDGTILTTLTSYHPHHEGDKYIVRFRPDFTSPFFYGWRRLFVVPDTILPLTVSDQEAVSKIIDQLLDAAVKQQE